MNKKANILFAFLKSNIIWYNFYGDNMIVDTHLHLFKEYYEDLEEVIQRMGNNLMIVSGINDKTNKEVLKLAEKYPNIYITLGIHPSEVDNYNDSDLEYIEKNLENPKVVGIGEIGLDYYWVSNNKSQQKELFIKQIKIAKKYNKPVIIHSRDSIDDIYEILKNEYEEKHFKIIMHCFSENTEWALKFINIGSVLGIGGALTFSKSSELRELVKNIDLKHIILETDSPYMTPVPYRGKRNEPKNVFLVAEKIAEIKEKSLDEVINVTTNNVRRQFDMNF